MVLEFISIFIKHCSKPFTNMWISFFLLNAAGDDGSFTLRALHRGQWKLISLSLPSPWSLLWLQFFLKICSMKLKVYFKTSELTKLVWIEVVLLYCIDLY